MNEHIEQLTNDIGKAIGTTKSMVGENPFADITLRVIVGHLSRANSALCQLAHAAKREADAKTITANKKTVDDIFDDFSEQGWSLEFKWQLLTTFLDQHSNPANRSNEKLEEVLMNQFDEECGFNDDDEPDECVES